MEQNPNILTKYQIRKKTYQAKLVADKPRHEEVKKEQKRKRDAKKAEKEALVLENKELKE